MARCYIVGLCCPRSAGIECKSQFYRGDIMLTRGGHGVSILWMNRRTKEIGSPSRVSG